MKIKYFALMLLHSLALTGAETMNVSETKIFEIASPNGVYVRGGDNLRIAWTNYFTSFADPLKHNFGFKIYYTESENPNEVIDVTEIVSNSLLELGYEPISWFPVKINEHEPWNCKPFLEYKLSPINLDKHGNLLISFSHKGLYVSGNNYRNNLCVWNKDYGVMELKVDDIDDIIYRYPTQIKGDFLIVYGRNSKLNQEKITVTSIADGFWGERKKIEPVKEQPEKPMEFPLEETEIVIPDSIVNKPSVEQEPEKEILWWERYKPSWWP